MATDLMGQDQNMIYIENNGTRVGILASRGGRVVYLSRDNSPNLLKADPGQWEESDELRPEISGKSGWKEYNGHIVWVGPQSEWWIRQDLNRERKASKAVWPPDPWNIYSNYKVKELTEESVVLRGPVSEITGLSMLKTISVDDEGNVQFTVKATNMRRDVVSWDLWLNTRVSGFAKSYVPVDNADDIKVEAARSENTDTVRWLHCDGYFCYLPSEPEEGFSQNSSKAFLTPGLNWLASFTDSWCLKIEFPETNPEKVHPEQAVVEVYNRTSENEELNLTELEYHTEYSLLQAGESIEASEKWLILPYKGKNNTRAHTRFLNRKFKKGGNY